MANSRSKRKPTKSGVPTVTEVKQMADLATEYVANWANTEARKIVNKELVIFPIGTGYHVGKYTVKPNRHAWTAYNAWDESINDFTSKKTAVLWCLLEQSGRYSQSGKILSQDRKVSKLAQDNTNYTFSWQRAIKNKDYIAADIQEARLSGIRYELDTAKYDLEKSINSAKYLKGIWEKPL